ncbi:MAG: chemotaxis protein CheD [Spirochaetes bacterium]|nr:chemotaxis protein CheD [Spirochaetota bacterium]
MHEGKKYGKPMKIIYPGEYYVSSNDEYIATVLGSCISVCLHDSERKMSGMNHFMLPGKITKKDRSSCDEISSRYGITAIKNLIESMCRSGALKKNLKAKIFGGGNVIDLKRPQGPVAEGNIRLARVMVELEDIPIVLEDIGGKSTRKIIMEAQTGKVFLRRMGKKDEDEEDDGL